MENIPRSTCFYGSFFQLPGLSSIICQTMDRIVLFSTSRQIERHKGIFLPNPTTRHKRKLQCMEINCGSIRSAERAAIFAGLVNQYKPDIIFGLHHSSSGSPRPWRRREFYCCDLLHSILCDRRSACRPRWWVIMGVSAHDSIQGDIFMCFLLASIRPGIAHRSPFTGSA